MKSIKICILLLVVNTATAGGSDVKSAIESSAYNVANQAFMYGNSAIESWARDNISSLRLIELETKIRDSSKPTFRLLSVFELTGNNHNALLSQISFSTFDVSKNFAPLREFGCFVVVIVTDSNSCFTDLSASNPDIAPDGR